MFKVKILKFYYKLSYGLLSKYFNSYIHKLEEEPARVLRCNIIYPPLIKRVYVECNLLFQLIKLINTLKVDPNDQILKKIKLKTHSYIGFGFNVTQIFLSQYNLRYCFSLGCLELILDLFIFTSITVIYQYCYLDSSYLHRFLFKIHY